MTQSLSSSTQKMTPMMEQYHSIKRTLPPDTILFYRLGDFYEMFFEDAERASRILNITLTGREGGAVGRVPMCGVPYHSYQPYVRTLLDQNLKVAICEQMGDPALSKGLVVRKVTRIITPATYLDEETSPVQPEYIVAVVVTPKTSALAALDLGTGQFFVQEIASDKLIHELVRIGPREAILPKSLCEGGELVRTLKENLHASITAYEDWIFTPEEGLRLLQDRFSLGSHRSIPFHDRNLAVSVAGAVLYYLKDHLHLGPGQIRLPVLLEAQEFMMLDKQTMRSLELATSLREGARTGTLFDLLDQTLTPMGSRTLYHWVTHPLRKLAGILYRQEGTTRLAEDPALTRSLRSKLKGIRDVERTLSRLNYGVGNARDLSNLRVFLERLSQLETLLKSSRPPILRDLAKSARPFPELHDLIAQAIVETPPVSLSEGGMIREGYSNELDDLKQMARRGKAWLLEFQTREMARTGIRSLRIRYNQVFGYSIEVSKPNFHLVPPEYIRRQTLANAERFIVPELKEWDQKISGAQEKMKELEHQLFLEIRGKVLEQLHLLQDAAKGLGILDALTSLGEVAVRYRWTCPTVTESQELNIQAGRHPVVELQLPPGQFVENDAFLDAQENQLLVLTGPNMAGKSTAIRQVALIVLLAQMGSFVPARSARIGLVDRIFTRIGARDDLARGESTFMVEMIEMAQILQAATDRSLLILDEVGRGTSTFDGVSLAWAICEHLVAGPVRPRTLFATHYHELTQLEGEFSGVKNYTITVRETPEGILFLRKVVRGRSDRSYGIHVAQLAGIPKTVTERADRILKVLENENTEATRLIEGRSPALRAEGPGGGEGEIPTHPVLEELQRMKVEGLTPLEALNRLHELKQKLREV